jgi:hypothetical protein
MWTQICGCKSEQQVLRSAQDDKFKKQGSG